MFQQIDTIQEEIRLRNVAENRIIDVDSPFTRESVQRWLYYLNWIIQQDKEDNIDPLKALPITFRICSEGGEALSALHLCSIIEMYQAEGWRIDTEVAGYAFSAGALLLVYGTKRTAYKTSSIMFHQHNQMFNGVLTFKDQRDEFRESEKLWKQLKGIICSKTLIKSSKMEDVMRTNTDWFLSPSEALQYGVIDEII